MGGIDTEANSDYIRYMNTWCLWETCRGSPKIQSYEVRRGIILCTIWYWLSMINCIPSSHTVFKIKILSFQSPAQQHYKASKIVLCNATLLNPQNFPYLVDPRTWSRLALSAAWIRGCSHPTPSALHKVCGPVVGAPFQLCKCICKYNCINLFKTESKLQPKQASHNPKAIHPSVL